ncbi:hypothetical protein [Rhizobium sp. BK376]|uniref:hypothetical protein n=1 Tax=Rhizobium sp. BK376 TaxID=2512149 RepID=UPI0010463C5F|nr:hypothetical protein [Rhizobium sp. BK376]TCR90732.1 hypothetical protein EV561_103123 [Rhizobium sp. BK376]
MRKPASMRGLEDLGRVRLSKNFFLRDFLHSEIGSLYGIPNIPENPNLAIAAGKCLCEELLEPLEATFGRLHLRSGYRAPALNKFGNKNNLNCARNEATAANHIWDLRDREGHIGATACVVVPWVWDRYHEPGDWRRLAWWIRDHLPYASLQFFPKLWAVNITWHEHPTKEITSYAEPRGILTRPGMANWEEDHSALYEGFPPLRS